MAAPLSSSAISASPSNSITAATSSRSGLVAASRRRKTAAADRWLPLCQVQRGDRRGGFLTPLDAAQHPGSVLEFKDRAGRLDTEPAPVRINELD